MKFVIVQLQNFWHWRTFGHSRYTNEWLMFTVNNYAPSSLILEIPEFTYNKRRIGRRKRPFHAKKPSSIYPVVSIKRWRLYRTNIWSRGNMLEFEIFSHVPIPQDGENHFRRCSRKSKWRQLMGFFRCYDNSVASYSCQRCCWKRPLVAVWFCKQSNR